jgi:leucyl aminopeptidase
MHVRLNYDDPTTHVCQALVVGCCEGEVDSDPFLASFDRALDGSMLPLLGAGQFTGKANQTMLIPTLGKLPAARLLVVGLGKRKEITAERYRQGGGTAIGALRAAGVRSLSSCLHRAGTADASAFRAAAEGMVLSNYAFDCYKSAPPEKALVEEVTFLGADAAAQGTEEAVLGETLLVGNAVHFVRDLVNQPGNVATPAYLAEKALEMAVRWGIDCRVLDRDELERQGMEAILAVAKGSRQPPRFIILEYRGGAAGQRPVVLIGKGVTFDSGGISLKPREGMEQMKDDMAGAAAVIGTLKAAAGLRLPLNLVGLVPAAENLPDGGAYKPGDLVRTMAGKTVEVVNTDAEGRMLLCDALHYAQQFRPRALVDLATLTGACVVALGSCASGIMANDAALARALQRAGERSGERLWELPLWDEYGELMKSDVADLKNAAGPHAGAISAGWFLKQFVDKTRWAHLDIAGTAWEEKGKAYTPKGASGVGVRLMIEYLRSLVEAE